MLAKIITNLLYDRKCVYLAFQKLVTLYSCNLNAKWTKTNVVIKSNKVSVNKAIFFFLTSSNKNTFSIEMQLLLKLSIYLEISLVFSGFNSCKSASSSFLMFTCHDEWLFSQGGLIALNTYRNSSSSSDIK